VRVVLTERAIADLVRIGTYIQQDNPGRAVTFVAELEHRCATLADMPYGYPLLPDREASGIRRRVHRDYLIFYRVEPEAGLITVLHVLNGAQDYEPILFRQ
jgi:plasmid stabilization system protein ParE